MESHFSPPPQRRLFLTTVLGGIAAVVAAAAGYPLWQYLSPRRAEDQEQKVAIPRGQIAVGEAHFFDFRGRPAVVLQSAPGSFAAFSAVCTHLGCIVKWMPQEGEFLCPCHAGRFSSRGEVLAGPPPKPLEELPVTLSGDQVLVG